MGKTSLIKESIFKIGRVISVEGRSVRILVNKNKNTSHILYNGTLIKNVSVGGYVKVIKGFIKIICKVEGEKTNEDKLEREDYSNAQQKINRVLQVSLIGFFDNRGFQRGIKELPLIDNECYLLENDEFDAVHDFIKTGDSPLRVGKLALENNHPIHVGVNSLFASHIGIFGNTGSGKSYTLANLYHQLFSQFIDNDNFRAQSKFYFIDFNGEYVEPGAIIQTEHKSIYKLTTRRSDGDKYPISSEHIKDTTFWSIILDATEKTQRPFIKRAISDNFFNRLVAPEQIKGFINKLIKLVWEKNDDSLRKSIIDFLNELQDISNSGEICTALVEKWKYHTDRSKFYFLTDDGWKWDNEGKNVLSAFLDDLTISQLTDDFYWIGLRIKLKYYDEIIKGFSNIEHLSPLIKRLDKRIDDLSKVFQIQDDFVSKTISIISLKDVNLEMRKMLPLLICKELYDRHKHKNVDSYLNLIIDEAHNILSKDSDRESEMWKDYRIETFEEIIKEGRKFGVFLTIASQRPSDISSTIISQLHNFFLHRLINNRDIEAVEKTISYLDKVSFEYLPILPTGTCILAGVLTNMPVLVDIDAIEKQCEPNNKTIDLIHLWA